MVAVAVGVEGEVVSRMSSLTLTGTDVGTRWRCLSIYFPRSFFPKIPISPGVGISLTNVMTCFDLTVCG